MTVYEFYRDFCRRLAPPPALTTRWQTQAWFADYFVSRGIAPEIVSESGVIPLTDIPSREENAAYKACLHQSRLSKQSGAPDPLVRGLLFPYDLSFLKDDFGSYGIARGLLWTEAFCQYYEQRGKPIPKMASPKTGLTKSTSHLYILTAEQAKLFKSGVDLWLIEGQAKTLKLIQDARAAGLADRVCVIGLQGVDQFLPSPGTHLIPWRNRGVYIFFDADAARKPGVAQAELKAAAFCLAKGAKFVKSVVWKESRGNGYDDHSVFAASKGFPVEKNLPNLIKKAKDAFAKYAPTDDDPGLPVESVCRAIANVPQLQRHQTAILVSRISKLYRAVGLKPNDVKAVFDQQMEQAATDRQTKKLKDNGDVFKQYFDLPYVPDVPEHYYLDQGQLRCRDVPLCKIFVIKKYISTEDADSDDFYLLSFKNKNILLPSNDFTNYRKIAEIFNRNQELLYDTSARAVQEYIARYWHQNRYKPIQVVPFHENTGWDKTGMFRIPTRDADGEYSGVIKRAFECGGDPERQAEFVRWVMRKQGAALAYMLGFVTPLLGLFNLPQMIVMIYGNPGDGKSTAAFAALSLYGLWKHLYQSMNATKVGKEVSCALAKDLPVCFDELNTAGNGDGKILAQELVSTIYEFYSGKGRTRSNKSISLAKQNEYQGLMMLTSERSLETIFSVMKNMNIGGAYRRTLEIPVLQQESLWNEANNFSQTDGMSRQDFFAEVYDNINTHYGYLGAEWIDYISDADRQRDMKAQYKACLQALGQREIELKGTDHLVALIEGVAPFVDSFLGLESGTVWTTIKDHLELTIQQQQKQINRQVRSSVDKFIDALNAFISNAPQSFEGVRDPELAMTKVFGKVLDAAPDENGDAWRIVFLRPEGLKDLCNQYGFDRNGLLIQLKESGVFRPWLYNKVNEQGDTVVEEKDYKSMRIGKTGGDVYRFAIPAPAEYDDADLVYQREEKANEEARIF